MASLPGGNRLDLGRLIMVPLMSLVLALDLAALTRGSNVSTTLSGLRWVGNGLTCAFYTLIIWCYFRRGPALATSRSVTAHAVAVVAVWAPFAIPQVRGTGPGVSQQLAADVLLVVGTGWSVWSLYFLGGRFSVIAQARELVDQGPYRWVRHPLYAGEIIASLGLAVAADSLAAVAVWLGFCCLQWYRAVREEQILLRTLPDYGRYRDRTAALLPGLF